MRDFETLVNGPARTSPHMLVSPFLKAFGWKLFGEDLRTERSFVSGYKHVTEEVQTWAGIATKENCVLRTRGSRARSGEPFYKSKSFREICESCQGKGIDLCKLTLCEATTDPQRYYATIKNPGDRKYMEEKGIIQEWRFRDKTPRYLICDPCEGKGYCDRNEEYIYEYFPMFNFKHRPRTDWQLEIDGEYLASGVGFSKLDYHRVLDTLKLKAAAQKLAERITSFADKAVQRLDKLSRTA